MLREARCFFATIFPLLPPIFFGSSQYVAFFVEKNHVELLSMSKKAWQVFSTTLHYFPTDLLSTSTKAQWVFFNIIFNPHTFIIKNKPMELFLALKEPPWVFSCNCCRNPSLRLATKARACKGAGQEWSPGVTIHAFGSVGKCEGMNPHTPKWTPTLGVGLPMDSQILQGNCRGQNSLDWKVPYTIGKLLKFECLN